MDRVGGYVSMNVSPPRCCARTCCEFLPACRCPASCSSCPSTTRSRTTPRCGRRSRRCAPQGLRLAIDDVGAGFSSLRHIVVTEPDVIKIDRSIVAGLATDPVLPSLVRSLVEFGPGCGALVVAEGVETAEEAARCWTCASATARAGTGAAPARPRR